MKNIIKTKMWVMSLLTLLLAYGCGDDAANNAIDNSVYFASVSNINTQRVTVDNITGASMPIQVRMAKESNTRTTVTVGVDENVLNSYNETNATGYAMLPADFYELSSNEAVVEVGSSLASSIILNVKPLSPELGKTGLTYAVPVAIQSVKGSNASVLSGSNYFIYLIVPTPIADVPVLSNGNGVRMKNQESPIVVTDYTVEFLIKVDGNGIAQGNNNQAIFNANNGTNDNDLIYTRFAADGGAGRYDKFSIKPHGGVEIETKYSFKNNTWYHIACVVDSKAGTCSIYVNGILDVKANVDSG
ncbi:MAG: DUF1735 and LamG domain-containing protein, partial [Prevotella sp.]|nr:DUF1735 and LamG domain-containing protein [Prevotella sp.]